MTNFKNPEDQVERIALWKISVLGPLISARLDHGERRTYFAAASLRLHEHPSGRTLRLSARTIESWYYAYRKGGLVALRPTLRGDRGRTRSILPEVADLLVRAKREKPRRSIRRLIKMLERARVVEKGQLHKSSVHRLLKAAGISKLPPREDRRERRSFLPEHASDLWMGDAMHGPLVREGRGLRKTYLISMIDAATRFLLHSEFYLSEGADAHERALKHAIYTAGTPRAYYVDRGSAYRAHSLARICGELSIQHILTKKQDAAAKGGIERWHRTWRDEVGDELSQEPLTLDELNGIHCAWMRVEYHKRVHETTGRAPIEHWLAESDFLRVVPRNLSLEEVFLRRYRRKVRKDGTVRFEGALLEVPGEFVGEYIELRFDPAAPEKRPMVYVDGAFHSDARVLDRVKNSNARRRVLPADPTPDFEFTGLDPLALMVAEHNELICPANVTSALTDEEDMT